MALLQGSASAELPATAAGTPKPVRSVSVCEAHELPSAGYPPVLVLSHPSMRKMAQRLVQATTARMLKLNLENRVSC